MRENVIMWHARIIVRIKQDVSIPHENFSREVMRTRIIMQQKRNTRCDLTTGVILMDSTFVTSLTSLIFLRSQTNV